MKDPALLIDADIVAYKIASTSQEAFDWGDTGSSLVADKYAAIERCNKLLAEYCETLNSNRLVICLSDKANFRKELEPTYKANRKSVVKPVLLDYIKEYLEFEYPSFKRPRLEADDIMGILATSGDRFLSGRKIIVSEDKDMQTVPCELFNPRKDNKAHTISREHALRYLMTQTLTGDPTDGYIGCRGVGAKSPFVQALQTTEVADLWDVVLEAYESKGFSEDDALLQARLAHILWARSYNFKTKKVKLWKPSYLKL